MNPSGPSRNEKQEISRHKAIRSLMEFYKVKKKKEYDNMPALYQICIVTEDNGLLKS
jgi:hypothetical protein